MNIRYRSMDLLRAVAITLVFLAHTVLSYGQPDALAPLQFGGTGVDLFFVLSGWLLGGQLFKELAKDKSINVKRFWFRRWLRTLPAYYAVLLASVAQRMYSFPEVAFPWEYFIFTQNYYTLKFFTISWSLCVEEQFYLAVAPLLLFLKRLPPVGSLIILILILLLSSGFRFMELYDSAKETHVRLDGCVAGVLLASIRYQHHRLWQKLLKIAPALATVSLLAYLFFYYNRWYPTSGIEDPSKLLLAIIFASWVLLANSSEKWTNRLYIPGANHIATRAYALYLLHPEALALMERFGKELSFLSYFSLAALISLIIAEVLYRLVEKPVMEMRDKIKLTK